MWWYFMSSHVNDLYINDFVLKLVANTVWELAGNDEDCDVEVEGNWLFSDERWIKGKNKIGE